jgi:hypothetical protein
MSLSQSNVTKETISMYKDPVSLMLETINGIFMMKHGQTSMVLMTQKKLQNSMQ